MKHAFVAVLVTVWIAGCKDDSLVDADPIPVRDQSPVQTDSLSYTLKRFPGEHRAYVIATYQNTTPSPVYFKRCNSTSSTPMFGIARTGPDSTRAFFADWAWACVGGVPTGAIAPGERVTVQVSFGSVDQPNMQPPLKPEDMVGTFRIHLILCSKFSGDSDYCEVMPRDQRQSNAFVVHY
jgi:hypothetical protein